MCIPGKTPTSRQYIPTVTEPYIPPKTPRVLTVPDETREMRRTHFGYLESDNATVWKYCPLPDTHLACPKQWAEELWSEHKLHGDSEFHLLNASPGYEVFVLQVSRDKNHAEKWVYEDIDPQCEMSQEMMDCIFKQVVDSLFCQSRAAEERRRNMREERLRNFYGLRQ